MTKIPSNARAGAGVVLVIGFVLVTALNGRSDYTLDRFILTAYITLITGFFGLHIVVERWNRIIKALSAALQAWEGNDD